MNPARCPAALILAILVLLNAAPARAADPAIAAAETSIRLGISAGYEHYEENISPQDTESGALFGVDAGMSTLTPSAVNGYGFSDLYSDIGYDFSAGYLGYHGNLNNQAETPYHTHDNAYFNTVVVRLGLGAPLAQRAEIIPYIAGGYQNWFRNIGGASGYGEYYQTGLLGGGVKFDIANGPALVISASAEGLAVISGSIDVPSQNFTGHFGTSAEERVSLDADYRLNGAWHAFAGLGLSHYGYTGSKPGEAGIYEPLSTSLQVNSMFGVSYGF